MSGQRKINFPPHWNLTAGLKVVTNAMGMMSPDQTVGGYTTVLERFMTTPGIGFLDVGDGEASKRVEFCKLPFAFLLRPSSRHTMFTLHVRFPFHVERGKETRMLLALHPRKGELAPVNGDGTITPSHWFKIDRARPSLTIGEILLNQNFRWKGGVRAWRPFDGVSAEDELEALRKRIAALEAPEVPERETPAARAPPLALTVPGSVREALALGLVEDALPAALTAGGEPLLEGVVSALLTKDVWDIDTAPVPGLLAAVFPGHLLLLLWCSAKSAFVVKFLVELDRDRVRVHLQNRGDRVGIGFGPAEGVAQAQECALFLSSREELDRWFRTVRRQLRENANAGAATSLEAQRREALALAETWRQEGQADPFELEAHPRRVLLKRAPAGAEFKGVQVAMLLFNGLLALYAAEGPRNLLAKVELANVVDSVIHFDRATERATLQLNEGEFKKAVEISFADVDHALLVQTTLNECLDNNSSCCSSSSKSSAGSSPSSSPSLSSMAAADGSGGGSGGGGVGALKINGKWNSVRLSQWRQR